MLYTVVTAARAKAIGDGLTYESDREIETGSLVEVPLRKNLVEGIVMRREDRKYRGSFDLKKILRVLSPTPLIPKPLMQTMLWTAEYYVASLRQVLQILLPPEPWAKMLPEDLAEIEPSEVTLSEALTQIPTRSEELGKILKSIAADPRPTLLFDTLGTGRRVIYQTLALAAVRSGGSAIILYPEIFSAIRAHAALVKLTGPEHVQLLTSKLTPAKRRKAYQSIRSGRTRIIIGTRTALFAPIPHLTLVILDDEHDWSWKSGQTPRYHARLAAEVLTKLAGAKCILGSPTPSLESWHNAKPMGKTRSRYHLAKLTFGQKRIQPPKITTIDLTTAQFGKVYPFTTPLLDAIADRRNRGEQSVLLLNRRGAATALLCMECRRTVDSPVTGLPLTYHVIQGIPELIDHHTGAGTAVPVRCPHCLSVELKTVGAGTQRAEALLTQFFPLARVERVDAQTLDAPGKMDLILSELQSGTIDIIIGTQPVIRALTVPTVSLAVAVLADIGLSHPNFRAGERAMQNLVHLIHGVEKDRPTEVIIQTFRPDAPEIRLAASGKIEEYLDHELALRTSFGYPPAAQMISFIVRGSDAAIRARRLAEAAHNAAPEGTSVSLIPSLSEAGRSWRVLLRGKSLRTILSSLDLKDVVVDVDPLEYD